MLDTVVLSDGGADAELRLALGGHLGVVAQAGGPRPHLQAVGPC